MASAAPSPSTSPVTTLITSVADSAFVIAFFTAILYFAGASFQHAYYARFGINPALLATTSIGIAVEGANAILFTASAWLFAILPILVVASLAALLSAYLDKRRVAVSSPPLYTSVAITAVRVLAITLTLLIVGFAGDIAGASQAQQRITNLQQNRTWSYHLARETISGVAIGQSTDASWILTISGVRQIKTSEIQRIDGPLLTIVTASAKTAATAPSAARP